MSARGILAYALERSSGECGPPALAIGLVLINFAALGWITASSDHGSFNASATVMHEIMLMDVPPCHFFVQQMYRVDALFSSTQVHSLRGKYEYLGNC